MILDANSDVLPLCDQTYVWISPVGLHMKTLHCSCSSLRHTLLLLERRGNPVVRTLAYHAAGPGSIPGLGGENHLGVKPGSLH